MCVCVCVCVFVLGVCLSLCLCVYVCCLSVFTAHREEGKVVDESDPLWDPENYTFTYKLNQETYELYDEQQILYPHNSSPSSTSTQL